MEEKELNAEEKVKEVIDTIRPFLQSDGGDIEFVKLEDNVVSVKLHGACAGCPGAQMTLQFAVERKVKEAIPEIEKVVAVN